jgi:HD-GYP domain-containing protein (c-di-GMP phosphodiesterase class II)
MLYSLFSCGRRTRPVTDRVVRKKHCPHHENWNGKGYPRGLERTETPLQARIVKIADAYDAMTSDRPYRPGMSDEEAVRRLEEASGTEFDQVIVKAFVASGVHAEHAPDESRSLRNLGSAVEIASGETAPKEAVPSGEQAK